MQCNRIFGQAHSKQTFGIQINCRLIFHVFVFSRKFESQYHFICTLSKQHYSRTCDPKSAAKGFPTSTADMTSTPGVILELLDVTLLAKGLRVEEIVRSVNYFIGALKVCLTVTYIGDEQ